MVLKLADDVATVWRTPTSLQLGIDAPRVVIDEVGAGEERLITALRRGISPSGWSMLARDSGVTEQRAGDLLAALEPVLAHAAAPASGHALVLGDGPISTSLAALLHDAGRLARPDDTKSRRRPALVVLVAPWVVGPEDAQHWLRRDVPHLPVVASDRSVTVGPFVEPGSGPCLYCGYLTRSDADPAWPAIAAQLWGRPAPRLSAMTVSAVAAFVAAARARPPGRGSRRRCPGVAPRRRGRSDQRRPAAPASALLVRSSARKRLGSRVWPRSP